MQHDEENNPPKHQQTARCVQGPVCFCVFFCVSCVFALGSAGAEDNRAVLGLGNSRDSFRQTLIEELFSDQWGGWRFPSEFGSLETHEKPKGWRWNIWGVIGWIFLLKQTTFTKKTELCAGKVHSAASCLMPSDVYSGEHTLAHSLMIKKDVLQSII